MLYNIWLSLLLGITNHKRDTWENFHWIYKLCNSPWALQTQKNRQGLDWRTRLSRLGRISILESSVMKLEKLETDMSCCELDEMRNNVKWG